MKRVTTRTIRQLFFGAKITLAYSLKKRSAKRVFFILCHYRTGSNLFISYLNTVPGAHFDDEILSRFHGYGLRRWWIPKKAVYRHARHSMHYRDESVRGAKFFFEDFEQLNVSLKDMVREFPDARWFILYRENILAQFLSHKIACSTQRWVCTGKTPLPETQVPFDPDEFLAYKKQIKTWYEEALKVPDLEKKSLWLSYEELSHDPQPLFNRRIFPFLGLPSSRIHTDLVKQNTRPPSEVIANYAEVRQIIERMDPFQKYEAGP